MSIKSKIKKVSQRWRDRWDRDLHDFEKVYPLIKPIPGFLKSPQQERWFFKTARKAPENAVIVEIGSFQGRSTVSFGLGCLGSTKHIYAIDLFEGDNDMYGSGEFQDRFIQHVRSCGVEAHVTPIKQHSLQVAATWNKPIDVLFIDGSHEYQDVKADFESFYPHVKKGGIIAFHDIKGKWDGVIRFWAEVQRSGLMTDFGAVSSLGFGIKK
ncbi:MAG TPA: class I SAM-dependent methyltransferase [Cyclobacteriaceae bacterium]|nr:class I SAM-dependent methyltransferase [Cyclobacteriaceae bacterium]HRJ83300.1 class I SAM-dependent methyltransferase [Cyclobacteriaceae bacterium]